MKIELKGYLKSASIPMDIKGLRLQDFVIRVPEKKNEFDEVVFKEQLFPCTVFKEKIEQFDLINKIGLKVLFTGYLNGREINTPDGKKAVLSLVLKHIDFL